MSSSSNDLQAARIFTEALALRSDERSRFLDQACAGNSTLRAKVDALLGADAAAGEVASEEPAATKSISDQATAASRREAGTNRIGRYRILEKIGEGGFGEVFIADQVEPVKRRVALKILKAGMDTKSVL